MVRELADACKAGGIKLGNLLLALGTAAVDLTTIPTHRHTRNIIISN